MSNELRAMLLQVLGLRYQRRATCLIEGDEDFGAIMLHTYETRPWWRESRLVERKPIDWLSEDEARERRYEIDSERED